MMCNDRDAERVDTPLTVDDLARQFGFTPEELALNRAGRFSARQRQTLIFRCVGYLVRGVGLLVLSVALTAYLTTVIQRMWEWALFGLLCALILVIAILLIRAALLTVARPAVHTITGTLHRSGDANHPSILAGDTSLRVSFRRWKRLAASYPGQYRFYVDPEHSLLSVELLSEDNES